MTPTPPHRPVRTLCLVAACVATTAAVAATFGGDWDAAPLRGIALVAIILTAVTHYGEALLAAVRDLRAELYRDIPAYGDERHQEGVIDGMSRARPAADLRTLR